MFIEACKNISSVNGEESCGGRPSGRTVRFAAWLLAASVILAGCGSKNTSSGSVSGGVAQASAEALTEESAGSDAAGQNSGDGFEIILDENGGRLVEASAADGSAADKEAEAETNEQVTETEPDYTESFACLCHYTGKAPPTALFTDYEYFVLTDDPEITWEEIERGMFSSQSGDRIRHFTVFSDSSGMK